MGCNSRLKIFPLNYDIRERERERERCRVTVFVVSTTLSSPPPADIISLHEVLCSALAGPPLFRQIKLLFCTAGKEILHMLNKAELQSPNIIHDQQ